MDNKHIVMKTKLIIVVVVILAACDSSAAARQRTKSMKAMSPRALVADLYRQHKQRSPFFQIRNRALLDNYFAKGLADLLWQDAQTSGGEVGALDGDPLFNAQDMDIKKFSIGEETVMSGGVTVPVSFENFGEKHRIVFRLVGGRTHWKIADVAYDDGSSLLEILKRDKDFKQHPEAV